MAFFHIVHVIYWVSVKTKFTIIMIHYCNFCLNTQPVSSKLQYNSFNLHHCKVAPYTQGCRSNPKPRVPTVGTNAQPNELNGAKGERSRHLLHQKTF